jgi:hypothetical protein
MTLSKIRLLVFSLALALVLSLVGGASAQTGSGSIFAAVSDGHLIINQGGDVYLIVELPPAKGIMSTAWSPDGSKLAFILSDLDYRLRLGVADAETGAAMVFEAAAPEAGFPVAFTPEGDILYAQSTYDQANHTPTYRVSLNRLKPEAGAQSETLGDVPFGVGCGGGSPLPGDWQYWQESGFGGSYLTLRWTSYGILHSVNCGGLGLALFDPQTGQDTELSPIMLDANGSTYQSVGRAALSPDGRTVAVIQTTYAAPDPIESLVFLDLETGALTEQETLGEPEQLAWTDDGALYYTVRRWNAGVDLVGSLPPDQKQTFETITGGAGFTIGTSQVEIHHLNLTTGGDQTIYTADAYQIGRMRMAADGSLWFSQIPNHSQWVEAIATGQINPAEDTDNRQQLATIPVSVYRLDLKGGAAPRRVGDNLNQFSLRPSGG